MAAQFLCLGSTGTGTSLCGAGIVLQPHEAKGSFYCVTVFFWLQWFTFATNSHTLPKVASQNTHTKKRSRSVSLKYNPDYIKGFAHFLAATILEHRSIVTGNGARTTKLKFTMKCNRRSMCRSPSVVIRMRCIHLIYFIWQTDVCIYTSQRFYFHTIEGSVDVIPCLAVVVIRYLPIIYNVKHWKFVIFFYLVIIYSLCIWGKIKKRLALNTDWTNILVLGLTCTEATPTSLELTGNRGHTSLIGNWYSQ